VTRAAARAAATVEICVDEIDVVHVIDVKDEMIPGEKDEVEDEGRKVLEAVTGNLVEGTVSEKVEGEEKSGEKGKKKKKNGTKRGKRKSRGGIVQEPEQQGEEDVRVLADVPMHDGGNVDDENVDAEGKLCFN